MIIRYSLTQTQQDSSNEHSERNIIMKALSDLRSIASCGFPRLSAFQVNYYFKCLVLEYYFCLSYFDQHKKDVYVIKTVNSKLVDLNDIVSRVLDITVHERYYESSYTDTVIE